MTDSLNDSPPASARAQPDAAQDVGARRQRLLCRRRRSTRSIDVTQENVTAFIGPSGCGKSTFLPR
jgi:phosphate transport system ATP-binding protein